MQSEDTAVASIVVGTGEEAAAVVGLAVETGTAADVVVPISGHTESIDTHFPDPSSIVPAGHSHLRLNNHRYRYITKLATKNLGWHSSVQTGMLHS